MEFNWKIRSVKEWRDLLQRSKNSNWMQTWNYAQASFEVDFLATKIALIEKNQAPIGMMCVQQIKLGPAQIVNLKRGPLWFVEPNQNLIVEFAEKFRKAFPKSLFQRLRWMPEMKLEEPSIEKLLKIGFKLRNESFITSFIDLDRELQEIKNSLHQKWRNCLNKSERNSLELKQQNSNQFFELFLRFYQDHQRSKKYKGPSLRFLRTELSNSEKTNDHFFLWAYFNKTPVAAIAVTRHGSTAAYRIGWNTPEGRKLNAHYALIWKAIELSKAMGHQHFDLGGLLPDDAPGVTHFKRGLNGQEIKLAIFGN